LLVGDTAGFLNSQRLKGIHLAIKSGMLAAETIFDGMCSNDLSEAALPAGTRLRVGSALLQVSAEPHAGCAKFRARFGDEALRWVNAHENRPRRLRGINLRIVAGGQLALGDAITIDR